MKERIPFLNRGPLVAVIRLNGTIGTGSRSQLNDEVLAPAIEKAFKRGKPRAVALLINSPGGSPVQSSLIASRIRRLADEKNIPVHAFVEDVAASGGYWLATAAESIWVDEASIVGSIGVISASFGAPVLLARQGVERRVHSSGKSKSFLDPFLPEKEEDVTRLRGLLEQMHGVFEAQVTSRRGARLARNDDLFTGEFWLGARAIELGLADGVAHLVPKMKELYGDDVRFAQYGRKRGLFQRFGISMAADAIAGVEERAAFARFGL
ncbi:MAG: S49 family peptidase [Pseudomonadota bacterium]|uniref:S49 family peptidase n=1 Tax=Roseovarius TaxID=74030 RepID=UPI0022A7554C|nr:S49 family peptidase [Roseovarius sp. EGI FJ00037]MCZ0811142.1 S49 family peptidase [Roseovarius sp. EGI FJ00037]